MRKGRERVERGSKEGPGCFIRGQKLEAGKPSPWVGRVRVRSAGRSRRY